ncbi:helix-turn-helix domain-containing protein [Mesorhizobium sp. M0134]|uniref:LexA family transcriptional regulator n=2 Tax=unclassified Mesorhizobium TaxID=325217 RepID=UPI003337A9F8
MESMGDRLRAARQKKFDSANKAAAALGVGASTYRAHENGQNEFGPEEAERYGRKFGVSAAYLLTGDGPQRLVSSFDPDQPDNSDVDDRTDDAPPQPGGGDVANLGIRGGLGLGSPEGVETNDNGQLYADHVNGFWSFPPAVKDGWRNMPQVYSIPVEGDSMEPTLTSGSYVFVDMTHTVPTPEDIYACDYGDGLTIKRLQLVPRTDKIRVMSDNQRYTSYELLREQVRVYGRVVAWFQWRG